MANDIIRLSELSRQNLKIRKKLRKDFNRVLKSGRYVSGYEVERFEEKFAFINNSKYAIGVSSGTSALEIALRASGIEPLDEVIVPSMTFIATAEAVLACGAVPISVDVGESDWNIDPIQIEKNINTKTKAVVVVHLHGRTAKMKEIKDLCDRHKIVLIEDSAQAHGAKVSNGLNVGNYGLAGSFSFYPGKNLGALGEAGIIVTNSEDVYEKAKLIRNWGAKERYKHVIRGTNYRMDEMQAAFLNTKLELLDSIIESRIEVAQEYDKVFSEYNLPRTQLILDKSHVYHIYAILVANKFELRDQLLNDKIETGFHYPYTIESNEGYRKLIKVPSLNRVAQNLAEKSISLPLHEEMNKKDVRRVIRSVLEFQNR